MAKRGTKALPYKTVNKLNELFRIEQGRRLLEGKKVRIRDVENELAAYCDVARDSIVGIKRGISQPSLPLAFKISEFFKANPHEVFKLVPNDGSADIEDSDSEEEDDD
jgi:DNA-binding XRE family transcriptional regulator